MDKTLSNQDGPTNSKREQVGSTALFAFVRSLRFLRRARTFEGKKTGMWNLIGWRWGRYSYSISWHPRCKSTRIGWYRGIKGNGGLRRAINLPILGDFSAWRGGPHSEANVKHETRDE